MRIAVLLALTFACLPSFAAAQAAPVTATILQSQRTGVDDGLGAAFDRTLRSRLDSLHVVDTAGAVTLDLEQIQLALGCMGETTECLTAVANETHATIVIVPSLARAGGTTQATLLVFDTRDQSLRRGERQATGADAQTELLGATDGLLREVFGLPAAPTSTGGPSDPIPPTRPQAGLAAGPFVLIGVGAAALIGGIVMGVLSSNDANVYAMQPAPQTMQDTDALLSIYSRAELEAVVANVLYVAGGALILAGVVWELAAGREDGTSPLALSPRVGFGEVGLALSGSFGGDL